MPGFLSIFLASISTDQVTANSDPFGRCIIKDFVKDPASDHRLLTIVSVGSAGRHSHIAGGADVDQFAGTQPFVELRRLIHGYRQVAEPIEVGVRDPVLFFPMAVE